MSREVVAVLVLSSCGDVARLKRRLDICKGWRSGAEWLIRVVS